MYAIENDYPDDIVMFCLNKFGLTTPLYSSEGALRLNNHMPNMDWVKQIDWSKRGSKQPVNVKNILFTATKKKRLNVLKELFLYLQKKDVQFISEFQISWDRNGPAGAYSPESALNSKVTFEANAIIFAIRELDDPLEYIQLFLQFSENPIVMANITDIPSKTTPLMESFKRGDVNIIKLLLDYGANPAYNSLLTWSILHDRLDYVEILLENNKSSIDSVEGLYEAIKQKNKSAILLLIHHGVNPLGYYPSIAQKYSNKSLLEVAFDVGDSEIIDILLNAIEN